MAASAVPDVNTANPESNDGPGNGQRAIWTFLIYTLCGPFLAALGLLIAIGLAPIFKLQALLPVGLPPLGEAVSGVFIWSALPAAFAAIMLVPMVWRRGTFGWIEAAAAGVIAFAAATVVAPFDSGESVSALAFLAGLISLLVRMGLLAGSILRPARLS